MPEGLVSAHNGRAALNAPDGGYATFPEQPASSAQVLERAVAVVRRYKWLVLALFVLGIMAGVIAMRLATPQYQVRATVWIQQPDENSRGGPILSGELLNSTGAWVELFRSFKIVDEVARKLALYLEPSDAADRPMFETFSLGDRFVPGEYELDIDGSKKTWSLQNAQGIEVERGPATDSVGRRVGFRWMLPSAALEGDGSRTIRFTVTTPRETSIKMIDRLENRSAERSSFLWLTYRDRDPHRAAQTLNTWLEEFTRTASELKKRNIVEFSNILEGQVRFAEKATQEAEAAYEEFRVNTITLPTEGGPVAAGVEATRGPALTSFFDQKIQYDNLRHDREALEKILANAANGTTPYEGMLLIPSVAQSPGAEALRQAFGALYEAQARLRAERQNFTDEYPTVKQQIAAVDVLQRQTIPILATQLLERLKERELDYQRRIGGASKELQEIPRRTIEELRLSRAVTVAAGLYTNLQGRYAEARLAEASATPDISVLDTATAPLEPDENRAIMLLLGAIAGGLVAGIVLAFLLDATDRKLRYSQQVSSELGLLVAGAVPRIPKQGIQASSPDQVVQFVEAFRSIRMHVLNSSSGGRITLAVTSAAPGDGKSLVAANLALSFADAGFRTVLLDGDTRRGSLHKMFQLSGPGGLTDFLQGSTDSESVARVTPHANLWLVSCGRKTQRSPELLASPKLTELVNAMSQMFEVVIFDTPPLAAGIDAYAISAAAGGALIVLRLGQTERRLAAAKLAILDRLPVSIVGAVINAVELNGEFKYYAYSSGYGVGSAHAGELVASSG